MEATVAVVQTRPETVLQDYKRLLRLAGLMAACDSQRPLALCLDHASNTSMALPAGASPPWQVEGVVSNLLASGYTAEGIRVLAPKTVRLDSEPFSLWQSALARIGMEPLRQSASTIDASLPLLLLAPLRTDRQLGVTGCLGTLAAHWMPLLSRRSLARQPGGLLDAWRAVSDETVLGGVIDATICGAGPDAWSLQPVSAHLLLASRDPVAVDAIAAWLAGFDPKTLPLIKAASRAGRGCSDPARINLVGDISGDLPGFSLDSASGYPSFQGTRYGLPRCWFDDIARYLPWGYLKMRRNRQRHEATAWGRLQQEYLRCGSLVGCWDSPVDRVSPRAAHGDS